MSSVLAKERCSKAQPPIPTCLRLTYTSFFAFHPFVIILGYTLFPDWIPQWILSTDEFASTRRRGATILALYLFHYNLSDQHPSTPLGAVALRIFLLFNAAVCALNSFALWDPVNRYPQGYGVTWLYLILHALWFVGGLVGHEVASKQVAVA